MQKVLSENITIDQEITGKPELVFDLFFFSKVLYSKRTIDRHEEYGNKKVSKSFKS
jgi:hypothetical protein